MRKLLTLTLCFLIAGNAHARKDCTELKSEIDAKITANGVPHYSLAIIEAKEEANAEGKVVGSCDGGAKRIVYQRLKADTTSAVAAK